MENGGTDYRREMNLIQAIEPGKLSSFGWVLDFRSWMGTRVSRDWLCFGRDRTTCFDGHLHLAMRD